jgi:hypothetical protein
MISATGVLVDQSTSELVSSRTRIRNARAVARHEHRDSIQVTDEAVADRVTTALTLPNEGLFREPRDTEQLALLDRRNHEGSITERDVHIVQLLDQAANTVVRKAGRVTRVRVGRTRIPSRLPSPTRAAEYAVPDWRDANRPWTYESIFFASA